MQIEHEPLARSANAVLEKLVAYDRAVGEYVQARAAADFNAMTRQAMRSRRGHQLLRCTGRSRTTPGSRSCAPS